MKKGLIIFFLFVSTVLFASNPLKVQVLDEDNQPLTGVRIVEVDKDAAQFTDFEGVSVLQDIDQTKVYRVEFVGYQSGYIKVSPNSKEEIKVVLRKK